MTQSYLYIFILINRIYLNNKFHGEIFSSNSNTYSYMFCDLIAGKSYDVTVQVRINPSRLQCKTLR